MKYSIIIPAFNEEKRIRKTLESYYKRFKRDSEIIVVCDGCKDRTEEVVKEFMKRKKNVRLLSFKHRLGKGGGVIKGFSAARGDIIGFTDADCSTRVGEFKKIIKSMNGHDCAIGSRVTIGIKQPIGRRFLGKSFVRYANVMFGLDLMDTQCGAKVFKKQAIKSIINDMKIQGFAFDVEMLYRLKKRGYKIKEVPIKWANDENSKVKFKHMLEMAWSLLKLRLNV